MGINVMRMLGSAIAGFVIEYAGFDTAYFITGGLYLFGLAMLFFLPPLKRATGKMASTWRGLKEGISYLRHDVTIMLILGASLLVFTLGMPYFSMLPVFVDNILKVGASGMGILLTVNGAGAIFDLFYESGHYRLFILEFLVSFAGAHGLDRDRDTPIRYYDKFIITELYGEGIPGPHHEYIYDAKWSYQRWFSDSRCDC
jgi:MFS family permease